MNSGRKLDFDAPLLSTRRPGRIIAPRERWEMNSPSCFDNRVPFSWEQSPGKPKEKFIRTRNGHEEVNNKASVPPLKPPPVRLHSNARYEEDSSSYEDEDDGFEGDVDDNDDDGFFSGGLDWFSLAESNNTDPMGRTRVSRKRAPPTPSFMMERFLPAAVALAVASSSYSAMAVNGTASSGGAVGGGGCTPRVAKGRRVVPSVSPPLALKSCGLEMLLPWRARPKKYSVKGPLRFGCSDWKPHFSPRPE